MDSLLRKASPFAARRRPRSVDLPSLSSSRLANPFRAALRAVGESFAEEFRIALTSLCVFSASITAI